MVTFTPSVTSNSSNLSSFCFLGTGVDLTAALRFGAMRKIEVQVKWPPS